jgi:hypothetical protein
LLLDHCVPQRLRNFFIGHEVTTAADAGWELLRNGALLAAAGAAGFHALVTVDRNLKHQQNLATLPIAVLVLVAPSNDIDELIKVIPAVLEALEDLRPRMLVEIAAEPT